MNAGYQPTEWHDFFVMTGSAVAAILGLLFVAVSLHLQLVLADRLHSVRMLNTLLGLLAYLAICGCALVPQPNVPLAWEWLVIMALWIAIFVATTFRAISDERRTLRGGWVRLPLIFLQFVLVVAAAISLMIEVGGGIFLVFPAILIGIAFCVINAWDMLATSDPSSPRAARARDRR
jgi:modulator of FtsH protease